MLYAACTDPSEDWGATVLAEALYTASNDVARVQSLLPELSPADRYVHPSPQKSSKPTSSQFSFVPPCKLSRSLAILNPVSLTDGLRLLWLLCCWTKLLVLWPSTTYRTLWDTQELTLSCEGCAEFDCSEMA